MTQPYKSRSNSKNKYHKITLLLIFINTLSKNDEIDDGYKEHIKIKWYTSRRVKI